MVNEKQGKVYSPRPVYCRKVASNVIREQYRRRYGQHDVNKNMAANSQRLRKGQVK